MNKQKLLQFFDARSKAMKVAKNNLINEMDTTPLHKVVVFTIKYNDKVRPFFYMIRESRVCKYKVVQLPCITALASFINEHSNKWYFYESLEFFLVHSGIEIIGNIENITAHNFEYGMEKVGRSYRFATITITALIEKNKVVEDVIEQLEQSFLPSAEVLKANELTAPIVVSTQTFTEVTNFIENAEIRELKKAIETDKEIILPTLETDLFKPAVQLFADEKVDNEEQTLQRVAKEMYYEEDDFCVKDPISNIQKPITLDFNMISDILPFIFNKVVNLSTEFSERKEEGYINPHGIKGSLFSIGINTFPHSLHSKFDTLRYLLRFYNAQQRKHRITNLPNLHEVINGPSNLYVDIDSYDEEIFNKTIESICSERFKQFFISAYGQYVPYILKDLEISCNVCISESYQTPYEIYCQLGKSYSFEELKELYPGEVDKEDKKYSAHIYIVVKSHGNRLSFKNQKMFWKLAKKELDLDIDMAVYKQTDKCARLRTIFCAKQEKLEFSNKARAYRYRWFAPKISKIEQLYDYIIQDDRFSIILPDLAKCMNTYNKQRIEFMKLQLRENCISLKQYKEAIADIEKKNAHKYVESSQRHHNAKENEKENAIRKFRSNMPLSIKDMADYEKALNSKWYYSEYEIAMFNTAIHKSTIYDKDIESNKHLGYTHYLKTVQLLVLLYKHYPSRILAKSAIVHTETDRKYVLEMVDGDYPKERRGIIFSVVIYFVSRGYVQFSAIKENINLCNFLLDNDFSRKITYADIHKHFKPHTTALKIKHNEAIYPPNTQRFCAVIKAYCNMKKTVNFLLRSTGANIYENVSESNLKKMFGNIPLTNEKKKILVITSRRTLAAALLNNTCGVKFAHYETYKPDTDEVPDNFIVQLESLGKFKELVQHFDEVFIDECSHFLNQFCHLKDRKAHSKYYCDLEGIFRRFFMNQNMIFSSANVNHEVYNFIKLFDKKVDYDFHFNIKVRKGWEVKNYYNQSALEKQILKWLAYGENLCIATFSKRHSELLKEMILSTDPHSILKHNEVISSPITEKDILIINSETTNIKMFDNMETFEKRVIIYTSSMSVGVSITKEHFTRNIVFCNNTTGLSSDEAYQMAFRNRNPTMKKVYIHMHLSDTTCKPRYDIEKKIFYLEYPYSQRYLLEEHHYKDLHTEGIMNQIYLRNQMYISWDLMNFYDNLKSKFREEGFNWTNKKIKVDDKELLQLRLKYAGLAASFKIANEKNYKEILQDRSWERQYHPFNKDYNNLCTVGFTIDSANQLREFYLANYESIGNKKSFFNDIYKNKVTEIGRSASMIYKNPYKFLKEIFADKEGCKCAHNKCQLYKLDDFITKEKLVYVDPRELEKVKEGEMDFEKYGDFNLFYNWFEFNGTNTFKKGYIELTQWYHDKYHSFNKDRLINHCLLMKYIDEDNKKVFHTKRILKGTEAKLVSKYLKDITTDFETNKTNYFNILSTINNIKRDNVNGKVSKINSESKDTYILQSINQFISKYHYKLFFIEVKGKVQCHLRNIIGEIMYNDTLTKPSRDKSLDSPYFKKLDKRAELLDSFYKTINEAAN